jgi:nucleoside-diphosphate-sugar epimerase
VSGTAAVSGQRCLVTGASGFIGARLTRRLVADGYAVRCLVRETSDVSALAGLDVELVRADLTEATAVADATDNCRFVVHCGALVSDWAAVAEIRGVNVGGTRNILDAAAKASAERFVLLSTTDVYGHPGGRRLDELQPPAGFANWYAQTKREAELEVRSAARRDAIKTVILRVATVYGPGSREVVGEMARAICRGQMLTVDGGRAIAGLVYVDNLLDAIMLALGAEAAAGETFNVSDELDVTWQRFLNDLAAGLNRKPPRWSLPYGAGHGIALALEHGYRALHRVTGLTAPALLSRQAVQVLGRDQDFSSARIRAALGWEPQVGYAAGMEATLAWLRDEYLPAAGLKIS